jgi:hypothetical protein
MKCNDDLKHQAVMDLYLTNIYEIYSHLSHYTFQQEGRRQYVYCSLFQKLSQSHCSGYPKERETHEGHDVFTDDSPC